MWRTILKRLKEPSTWIGISVLATIVGVPPGTVHVANQVIGAIGAIAGIVVPENQN
jgi:hypothetical protein